MDTKSTTLPLRIEGAREVLRRSRITFLISIVISLSLFIASFNAHWSWYRRWPIQNTKWAKGDVVVQRLQEEVYSEWAKSRFISISPLGIQVGSRDAVPLGALTLLIISAWSFGCVRRHTYVIRRLLLDTRDEENLDVRQAVYHGITAQRLFGEVIGVEEPTTRLDGQTDSTGFAHWIQRWVRWIPYLPMLMIALLLTMDVGSIFWEPAPLRTDHRPLVEEFCIDANLNCTSGKLSAAWTLLWTNRTSTDPKVISQRGNLKWALGAWSFVLVIALIAAYFAYRTVALERGVDSDLKEYEKLLRAPPKASKHAGPR